MASEDTSPPASPADLPTTSDSLGVPKQRVVAVGGSNGDSKPVAQIRTARGSVRDMIAKFERNATPIAPPDKGLAGAGNRVPGRVRSWGKVDVKKEDSSVAKGGSDTLPSATVEKQELPREDAPKQDAPKQDATPIESTESAPKKSDDDVKVTGDGDDVTKTADDTPEGASVAKLESDTGTGTKGADDSKDDDVHDEPVTAIEDEQEQTAVNTEGHAKKSVNEEPAKDAKHPESQDVNSVEDEDVTEEPDEALAPKPKKIIIDNPTTSILENEELKDNSDKVPNVERPIDPMYPYPKLEEPQTSTPSEPHEPTVPPPSDKPSKVDDKLSETTSEEESNDEPRANDRDPASVETF